jgi:hypothetical protein
MNLLPEPSASAEAVVAQMLGNAHFAALLPLSSRLKKAFAHGKQHLMNHGKWELLNAPVMLVAAGPPPPTTLAKIPSRDKSRAITRAIVSMMRFVWE